MTIDQLTSEQLKNPDIFEKIKELSDSFVLHIQAKEAYQFQEKLTSLVESSSLANLQPELYKKYQDLITQLKWAASPIIPDEEFLKLLKENYLIALKNENIDAQDRIEAKMFTVGLFPRNELRQKIHKAIRENKEKLGTETIGEWAEDYNKTFDPRERTKVSHLEYISKTPEVQTLPEKEKNILRTILWTFDSLLLATPVMSDPLFSEAYKIITGIGIVRKPIPFPVPPAAPPKIVERLEIKEPKKPKKPGLFEKLFGKKEEKPEELKEIEKIEEAPKKISVYEEKISPYEKKRRFPITEKEIPTFPEQAKEKEIKKTEEVKEAKPQSPLPKLQYKIRTMKQDIEKAKRQPIPPKPEPKIKE